MVFFPENLHGKFDESIILPGKYKKKSNQTCVGLDSLRFSNNLEKSIFFPFFRVCFSLSGLLQPTAYILHFTFASMRATATKQMWKQELLFNTICIYVCYSLQNVYGVRKAENRLCLKLKMHLQSTINFSID